MPKKNWGIAEEDRPVGWIFNTYTFPHDDPKGGKKNFYIHVPATGERKGTYVFLHGLTYNHRQLAHILKELQDNGYDVWFLKLKSAGRGDHIDEHLSDTRWLVRDIVRPHLDRTHGDKSLSLLSHSYGGHIGMRHLLDYPGDFDDAVFLAPALMPHRAFGRITSFFNALNRNGSWDEFSLSSFRFLTTVFNANRKRSIGKALANGEKPDRRHKGMTERVEGITLGFFNSLNKSCETLMRRLPDIRTPVHFVVARQEDSVDNGAIEEACKTMPRASIHRFDCGHDLLHQAPPLHKMIMDSIEDGRAAARRSPRTENAPAVAARAGLRSPLPALEKAVA